MSREREGRERLEPRVLADEAGAQGLGQLPAVTGTQGSCTCHLPCSGLPHPARPHRSCPAPEPPQRPSSCLP
ncbi:hypothetical protein PAL_GLEAN10022867 [Pteropus alecto]|uniref:Uncharacterized protein n=1 Tax=Pteropus alecto TaxID=9402 RepID=L5K7T4_PTEAL|nr:hypothetical protein PAL_GLEAN10022867 [Pteropus alecto]